MTKNESIEYIKKGIEDIKNFAISLKKDSKETKLATVYSSNETSITTDSGVALKVNGAVEIGADIYSFDKDYNQIVAADGEYTYSGTKIRVSGGKIDLIEEVKVEDVVESPVEDADVNMEVKAAEEVKEEVKEEVIEEKKEEEVKTEDPKLEERIKSLEDIISKILPVLEGMMNSNQELETKNQELETEKVELSKKVQELSEQPGDVGINDKKNDIKVPVSTQEEIRTERLKEMAGYFKSNRP